MGTRAGGTMNLRVSKSGCISRCFHSHGVKLNVGLAFGLFTAAAMLFTSPARAANTTNVTTSILVVEPGDNRPAFSDFMSRLRQILTTNLSSHVVVYRENLDLARFGGTSYRANLEGWLRNKYQGRKLDVIVASGETSIDFILKVRLKLWPQVPVIAIGTKGMETTLLAGQTNVTGITMDIDVAGTLKAALHLCPNTRRIAFVSSKESDLPELHGRDLKKVEDFCRNRFELIKLVGLTMAETKQRLAALPPGTIVFYDDIWVDASGQIFMPRDALEELSAVSRAPIFSYADTYIGFGMVGGSCLAYRTLATEAAGQIAAVFRAGSANAVPVMQSASSQLVFDARQMQKYGLSEKRIPPGSSVRFHTLTLWEAYYQSVMIVMAALVVQTGLIAALLWQRRRNRESEQRFRTLLDNAPDAVYVQTKERIAYANQATLRLLRAERQEQLLGQYVLDVVAPEWRKIVKERMQQMGTNDGPLPTIGEEYLRVDKSRVAVEVSAVPVVFHGERGALVFVRDITERKQLEEQLRQSQKMEAFGQLAGGVAHDFNNLLTVIQGNVALLQLQEPLNPDQAGGLVEIAKAAERAANLTRQLLTFSRRQLFQPKPLDLNEVVANTSKMLQRLIGEHISLETHFAPGGAPIKADRTMMEQILINLAVNSRDAMPKGGCLIIQTAAIVISETEAQTNPKARPGAFIRLKVTDTGCGIAPKEMDRIFEPFFTTKEVGKGTGLGLATVFGIVAQHHGWIEVESRVNTGTTFHIYLPRLAESEKSQTEFSRAPEVRGGNETILLVEDEAPVRTLARTLLERKGYRVIEADSGLSALQIWQEHRNTIDLLFTDMVMPEGISGRELAGRLLAEKPGLKVIYSSGYTDDMLGENSPLRNNPNFLEKPFSSHKLLKRVRDCLDGVTGS